MKKKTKIMKKKIIELRSYWTQDRYSIDYTIDYDYWFYQNYFLFHIFMHFSFCILRIELHYFDDTLSIYRSIELKKKELR